MTQTSLAAAADYSDALSIARRAKTSLFWIIFAVLIAQLSIFFAVRYSDAFSADVMARTRPKWVDLIRYVTNTISFLGIVLTAVLASDLLLIVLIMIMARLIGVARITSAYLWCVVLGILLFPWQAFLYFPGIGDSEFRLPGVLFTWGELITDARFMTDPALHHDLSWVILKWARFVGFPVLALVILFGVQLKSARGLRQAFGGSVETASPPDRLL